MSKESLVIYFLEAVGGDAVRVSWCGGERELKGRILALQGGNALELRLLGLVRSQRADERALHQVLDRHRLRGEWFRLSSIRAQVKGWLAGKPLPTGSDKPGHAHHPGAGFRKLPMTAMVEAVPDQAMEKILEAFRKANGDLKIAAPLLGCTWRTLYRWIDRIAEREPKLPIREELKRIGEELAAAPAQAAAS
jgi:hypothetical protein